MNVEPPWDDAGLGRGAEPQALLADNVDVVG
jgi:hypothetical protein